MSAETVGEAYDDAPHELAAQPEQAQDVDPAFANTRANTPRAASGKAEWPSISPPHADPARYAMPDINRALDALRGRQVASLRNPNLSLHLEIPGHPMIQDIGRLLRESTRLENTLAQLRKSVTPDVGFITENLLNALRIDTKIFIDVGEHIRHLIPANLKGVSFEDQLAVIRLGIEYRIGVCYVLRPETVRLLLDRHEGTNNVHVETCLDGFNELDLTYVDEQLRTVSMNRRPSAERASILLDATAAFRDGHYAASQALSTVAWDSEITELTSGKALTEAKKLVAKDLEDSDLLDFYQTGVFGPLVAAYTTSDKQPCYGRNTTIHYARPDQFNKPNAVRALTIAVSLIAWSTQHRPNRSGN